MNIVDLINKKRLNGNLSYEEINFIINGYLNCSIKDYQMSSLLMAICINGMDEEEIFNLTKVMIKTGDVIDLSAVDGVKVDKHSTGGVGDKTTLILIPLVATCGVKVPKMSGRGIGYTGGTIDKLESILGININLSEEEIIKQLKEIGGVISTSTKNIVPADKKIYALRDVTGTVSSLPLIASSIMSKKIATGAEKIVLDVKVGKGGSIKSRDDAIKFIKTMIELGNSFNKEVIAIISNMDYPIGNNIGNGLEVIEAIDILNGSGNKHLRDFCITFASYMVSIGKNISLESASDLVIKNLNSGLAYQKFKELITYQSGDINQIEVSKKRIEVTSTKEGYINSIDALKVGKLVNLMGAGRTNINDVIDYGVGIVLAKNIGEYVKKGDLLLTLHVKDKEIEIDKIRDIFEISQTKKQIKPLFIDVITKDDIL